jgi:hypothetical protein
MVQGNRTESDSVSINISLPNIVSEIWGQLSESSNTNISRNFVYDDSVISESDSR